MQTAVVSVSGCRAVLVLCAALLFLVSLSTAAPAPRPAARARSRALFKSLPTAEVEGQSIVGAAGRARAQAKPQVPAPNLAGYKLGRYEFTTKPTQKPELRQLFEIELPDESDW